MPKKAKQSKKDLSAIAKGRIMLLPAKKKKQPRKNKKGKVNSYGLHANDRGHFLRALMNPFSPEAVGARVCDAFPMPTATYHVRGSLGATASASGTFKCIILPSPCFTFITRPSGWGSLSGGTDFSQNAVTSGTAGYLVTPTAMNAVLTEYRVVAWGIRLLAKDTALAAKGKIMIAVIPTTNNAPSWNTMETVTATDSNVISEYCCGMEFGASNSGSVLGLPGVQTYSIQDLMRGEVRVNCLPSHVEFYAFKGTADRSNLMWASGQVLADEGVFNNTTGLVNATAGGRKDIASLRGGVAVVIVGSGLPASTNEFDIEIVYHCEGTPNVAASASAQLVPSSVKTVVGDTSMVEKLMGVARTAAPIIAQVSRAVVDHSKFSKAALPGATLPLALLAP